MIKSSKPGKQRKYRKLASMHVRRKLMSSHLSPELRKKVNKRSVPIRKGDEVKVMRGSHKGFTGKVERVNRKKYIVFIDGLVYEKKNGDKVKIGLKASNLLITGLDESDGSRFKEVKK